SMEGSSMMVIDMSDVSAADLNPRAATNKNAARRTAANMPKGVTNATDVVIKLTRPSQFMVQSKGIMAMGRMRMTNTMAVWSPGETNYALMIMGGTKRFNYADDRASVMAISNQGGGSLASSVVQLFFGDENST